MSLPQYIGLALVVLLWGIWVAAANDWFKGTKVIRRPGTQFIATLPADMVAPQLHRWMGRIVLTSSSHPPMYVTRKGLKPVWEQPR